MAMKLADAYVQIIPVAKGIAGKLKSELDPGVGAAGDSAGGLLGGRLLTAIKVAAIGAAVYKGISAAIKEGAKLEQSEGGIQTLFKGSADAVIKNAQQAYKTAGISANTYMEQVTSFSASLLNSLGGDTQKAASAADMAVRDMADNSNKFGTSIESIQNAYQGFAKQNYTMLDNLKLGYGGTKTEMERLLTDAQKITGIKYDINNLNDVYSAIHAVQTELGVTGATANEAKETLAGSFNAMSAAWTNFLGNLAMGKDIGPSISNLIDSVMTFVGGNLLPAVGRIVEQIPEMLLTLAKSLDGKLGSGGIEMFESILKGMGKTVPKIIPAVIKLTTTLLQTILKNLPKLIETGIKMVVSIAFGLIKAIPQIVKAIPKLVKAIFDGFKNVKWLQIGSDIVNGIVSGVKNTAGKLWEAAKDLAEGALKWVKKKLGIASPSRVFKDEVGKMIPLGFSKGVDDNAHVVTESMERMTKGAMKSGMPKITYDTVVGKRSNIAEDLINGIAPFVGMGAGNITIPLIVDGKKLAEVVYDPINKIAVQKGVIYG